LGRKKWVVDHRSAKRANRTQGPINKVYGPWGLDILGSGGEDHLRIIAGAVVNGGEMGSFVPLLA
jgi:hypothetical protein